MRGIPRDYSKSYFRKVRPNFMPKQVAEGDRLLAACVCSETALTELCSLKLSCWDFHNRYLIANSRKVARKADLD